MAKLTKAQQALLNKIQKTKSPIYFTRDKKDFERCYIGNKRVNSKVFFFFYDIEYLSFDNIINGRKYKYYYLTVKQYKLDEYLEDFKAPYVVPE